jgi:hypothetical protein
LDDKSVSNLDVSYGAATPLDDADYKVRKVSAGGTITTVVLYTHPGSTQYYNVPELGVALAAGDILFWDIVTPPTIDALGYTITLTLETL